MRLSEGEAIIIQKIRRAREIAAKGNDVWVKITFAKGKTEVGDVETSYKETVGFGEK